MGFSQGKYAYINGVPLTGSWAYNEAVAGHEHSDSGVAGGMRIGDGVVNGTGAITGFGAQPPLFPGTALSATLVKSRAEGANKSLIGSILVNQLTIEANYQTQTDFSWTANFGAQGILANSATAATPTETPDVENGKDLAIMLGADEVLGGTDGSIVSVRMDFRCNDVTRVHNGATYRQLGNLSAEITLAMLNDDLYDADFARNKVDSVKIYVSPDTFWQFDHLKWQSKTDYKWDNETRDFVGYTVVAKWTAGDSGQIIAPDESVLWEFDS
jgi:hypothetical protein